MPFLTNDTSGIIAGEIDRDRKAEQENARRAAWGKSHEYTAFYTQNFIEKINANLEKKKKEYDAIAAGFFGRVKKKLTRCEEKDAFLNDEIEPLLVNCQENPSAENKKALTDKLQIGIKRFTTFEKQSGIARILEEAFFALTDTLLAEKANFDFAVVATVVPKIKNETVVVGKVLDHRDHTLFALSQVRVPEKPIVKLFRRAQKSKAVQSAAIKQIIV